MYICPIGKHFVVLFFLVLKLFSFASCLATNTTSRWVVESKKKKKKPWTSLLIFVSLYHYLLIYLSRRIHICVPNSILFVRIYCHFREWVSFWAWSNSMFVFHFLVMTGFRKSIIIAKWVTQHRVIFKMLSIHRLPKGIFQLSSVV